MKKLTTQQVVNRFKNVHGIKYDYSKVQYNGMDEKVIITCPVHGDFEQTPHNHLRYGCLRCGINKQVSSRTISSDTFIKCAKKKFGNKFDYSFVKYVNSKTPVKILCKKHGIFEQLPYTHLHSYGCPKCGLEEGAKKSSYTKKSRKRCFSLENFKKVCTELFCGKYDYSLITEDNWCGLESHVDIICPVHGVFNQLAKSHRWGRGCKKCNQSKGEFQIQLFLNKTGIKYKTEYTFDDCVDKCALPFDFVLFNEDGTIKCIIEYQGRQHFEVAKFWGKTEFDLIEQQRRDQIKRDYCTSHNYCLLEVSYNQDIEEFFEEAGGLLWK